MGRESSTIFNTFSFDPAVDGVDPKYNYDAVLAMFDRYFVPKRNVIHERTKFYQRMQNAGESVELFVRGLHELARYCNFADRESKNIRDRLIAGISDKELSQNLQVEQDDLTLEKATDTACHWEMVKRQNATSIVAATSWDRGKPQSSKTTSQRRAKKGSQNGRKIPKENAVVVATNIAQRGKMHVPPRAQSVISATEKGTLSQCVVRSVSRNSGQHCHMLLLIMSISWVPSSVTIVILHGKLNCAFLGDR
jgi:hypothetical protein